MGAARTETETEGEVVTDVVVTLPQAFGLAAWVAEGDAAGQADSGTDYYFTVSGPKPKIMPGERVYVTYKGHLIGYAPLVRLFWDGFRGDFVRRGGAQAVTIEEPIRGFRGWRYRWWKRETERPYEDWLALGRRA